MTKEELKKLKVKLEECRDEQVKIKKTTWYRPVEISEPGFTSDLKNLYSIEEECDTVRALESFEKMMEVYIKTLVDNGIDFDKVVINLPFTVFVDSNNYEEAIEEDEYDLLDGYNLPKNLPILDEYVGVYLMDLTVYNKDKKQTIYGMIKTMEQEFKQDYTSMHIVEYSDFMTGLKQLGYNFSEISDFEDLKASLYDGRLASTIDTIVFDSHKVKSLKNAR